MFNGSPASEGKPHADSLTVFFGGGGIRLRLFMAYLVRPKGGI
jgi:hypothetical protein